MLFEKGLRPCAPDIDSTTMEEERISVELCKILLFVCEQLAHGTQCHIDHVTPAANRIETCNKSNVILSERVIKCDRVNISM
jgi:hypothetical protein